MNITERDVIEVVMSTPDRFTEKEWQRHFENCCIVKVNGAGKPSFSLTCPICNQKSQEVAA